MIKQKQLTVVITKELVERTLKLTKKDLFNYPCQCPVAIGITESFNNNLVKGVDFKVTVDPWTIEIDFGSKVKENRYLKFPMTEYLAKWVKQFDRDFFDALWDKKKQPDFLLNFKEFSFVMF